MFVDAMSKNDGDVAEIESGCRDIEDRDDCLGRTDADQIETAAESYYEPDGVDWRLREVVDFAPPSINVRGNFPR